jgi:hypothetical protein
VLQLPVLHPVNDYARTIAEIPAPSSASAG